MYFQPVKLLLYAHIKNIVAIMKFDTRNYVLLHIKEVASIQFTDEQHDSDNIYVCTHSQM